MIDYMKEGATNKKLVKLETLLIDLLKLYLEDEDQDIMTIFYLAFKGLN